MMDWQPIETGPRNGDVVLLYLPGPAEWPFDVTIAMGCWDGSGVSGPEGWRYSSFGNGGFPARINDELRIAPTYWMRIEPFPGEED